MSSVTNFRDVGVWVNLIAGQSLIVEDRLYRGGSINCCYSPDEILTPDLIIGLSGSIDRVGWAPVLHKPKPDDMECYATQLPKVRRWLVDIAAGIAKNDARGRVYVHCHSGADRTGVVVATLLKMVRLPDAFIVEEYALSAEADSTHIKQALNGLRDLDEWLPEALREQIVAQLVP